MARRISAAEFDAEVLQKQGLVIVDFYSDSCVPCKALSPILGEIEDRYEDEITVLKVNVNFDADLAAEHKVMASPTLLFFVDGKEVERVRGLITEDELDELVQTWKN